MSKASREREAAFRLMDGGRGPGGQIPQLPRVAVDRFGKLIESGHLVMFHSVEDLIFEVVNVGPVLNPGVQGGQAVQAVLTATFPVQFLPGMPNRGMVIVGESKARLDAKAANNGKVNVADAGFPEPSSEGPSIVLTDADAPVSDPPEHESGRPCGCDPGATPPWVCEQHQADSEE